MQKFFSVICNDDVANSGFTITRSNMEEMVLKGPASIHDLRIVNSYPSKVASLQKSAKVCKSLQILQSLQKSVNVSTCLQKCFCYKGV